MITWLSLSETLPDVARSPSLTLDFHPPTGQKTTAQQWGKLVCENIRDRCWRIYAVVVVISARIEIPTFSFFFFFPSPYASSTSEVLFVLQLSLLRQPFSGAILPDPFAVGGAAWDLPTFQTVAPFFFFFLNSHEIQLSRPSSADLHIQHNTFYDASSGEAHNRGAGQQVRLGR